MGGTDDDGASASSGSLCKRCLRESLAPIYRRRQSLEHNFDCFGKAVHYCDQFGCKYRPLCLSSMSEGEECR